MTFWKRKMIRDWFSWNDVQIFRVTSSHNKTYTYISKWIPENEKSALDDQMEIFQNFEQSSTFLSWDPFLFFFVCKMPGRVLNCLRNGSQRSKAAHTLILIQIFLNFDLSVHSLNSFLLFWWIFMARFSSRCWKFLNSRSIPHPNGSSFRSRVK